MIWQREAVHKQHVLFKDKSDPSKIIKTRLDTLWRQRRKIRKANKKHDKSDTPKQYSFCSQCCFLSNTNQDGNLFVMPLGWWHKHKCSFGVILDSVLVLPLSFVFVSCLKIMFVVKWVVVWWYNIYNHSTFGDKVIIFWYIWCQSTTKSSLSTKQLNFGLLILNNFEANDITIELVESTVLTVC